MIEASKTEFKQPLTEFNYQKYRRRRKCDPYIVKRKEKRP